jgi:hypothetical protein
MVTGSETHKAFQINRKGSNPCPQLLKQLLLVTLESRVPQAVTRLKISEISSTLNV